MNTSLRSGPNCHASTTFLNAHNSGTKYTSGLNKLNPKDIKSVILRARPLI